MLPDLGNKIVQVRTGCHLLFGCHKAICCIMNGHAVGKFHYLKHELSLSCGFIPVQYTPFSPT